MILVLTVQPLGSPQTSVEKVQCQRDCRIESDNDKVESDNDNWVSDDDRVVSVESACLITK